MPKKTSSSRKKSLSSPKETGACPLLTIGPLARSTHLLLAHGAGALMTSPFLTSLAELLNVHGITVHRFEFPYMAIRRRTGQKRPPPPITMLDAPFQDALTACLKKLTPSARLFIGGKSMGARVATRLAADPETSKKISGLILLGYPFHPPNTKEKLRLSPFTTLKSPTLLLQGTRDPFGSKQDVDTYSLPRCVKIAWMEDADHDFKPRRASGHTQESLLKTAAHTISTFMQQTQHAHTGRTRTKIK